MDYLEGLVELRVVSSRVRVMENVLYHMSAMHWLRKLEVRHPFLCHRPNDNSLMIDLANTLYAREGHLPVVPRWAWARRTVCLC